MNRGRADRVGAGAAVAVLAVVIGLVSGCTSDSDGQSTGGSGATTVALSKPATPTTTPETTELSTTTTDTFVPVSPQEPPPPPEPEQTPESAVEFLQWWFLVFNYAELTGETAGLQPNSSPECIFCAEQIDNIAVTYSAGNRVERVGDTTISNLQPSEVDLNGNVALEFDGSTPEYRVIDRDGAIVGDAPGTSVRAYNAAVEWFEGKWRLRELAEKIG